MSFILSIIMPVWNQEKLVLRALDSIPERKDIETIVINDCSDDKTLPVLEVYKRASTNNIRIINNLERLRVGKSINKGLDVAKGRYILQLDSDDYLSNEANSFIDLLYNLDYDLIFFNNQINNGDIWRPQMMNGLCDHICLYKKDIIGDTRHSDAKWGTGWNYHQTILAKQHTEYFSNILLYHYNFPRKDSNYDLGRRGLLD